MTQNNINNSASSLTVDNLFIDANTISSTDTNGNVIFAPNGTGNLSITDSAILPNGDRAENLGTTSNAWNNAYLDGITFNDGTDVISAYERGTFTPTITFGGGSTGITYATQTGIYVRIANVVCFKIQVVLTSKGTDVGSVTISVPAALTAAQYSRTISVHDDVSLASGTQYFSRIDPSGTTLLERNCGSGVTADLTDANYQNTARSRRAGIIFI